MAWNGKSQFLPDWSGLEWKKSVLACLEWPGIEEVSFRIQLIFIVFLGAIQSIT
jgi:hypothetical protein